MKNKPNEQNSPYPLNVDAKAQQKQRLADALKRNVAKRKQADKIAKDPAAEG